MSGFSANFIKDLPIEAEAAAYRARLEKASKAFTKLICEYRATKEIPITMIDDIQELLRGEGK